MNNDRSGQGKPPSNFHIIIPARYASERLPAKVLADLNAKPLIQHVYERALRCGAQSLTLAVDDARVARVAESFGANLCMTATHHPSGTDRLYEVVEKLQLSDAEIVINIQGDEPLVPPEAIWQLAKAMEEHPDAAMSTLCTPIHSKEDLFNANIVKLVLNQAGYALYFSRAPIPWDRGEFDLNKNPYYYRHIGLYAYRVSTLRKYHYWEPSPLEKIESLEQLRILWHGEKIHVSCVENPWPHGVDTPEDLLRLRSLLA